MTRDHGVDAAYMQYQYGDAEKLRIRYVAHQRYSERTSDTFRTWLLAHVDARAGQRLLDVGCGPGPYHLTLAEAGVIVTGVDTSTGMLREALGAARAGGYAFAQAVASAEQLPFADATFDRVMANHMLYHVPDQRRALDEMRRVLAHGGRIVLATNGAANGTHDLHCTAARAVEFVPAPSDAARFTLDDLALVRSVFPSAEVDVREDALLFPDAASFLRYYASSPVDRIDDRPAEGSHRRRLMAWMERYVSGVIEQHGVLRLPKSAGCFVADV